MTNNAFEVDAKGLQEILGAVPTWRHALELVANVFDEYKGYNDRLKPSACHVTATREGRKTRLLVSDDGAGFENVEDIWTFFGTTGKRHTADVSGRFNAGDKQLFAIATEASIHTGMHQVLFHNGIRTHTKFRAENKYTQGTRISALLTITKDEHDSLVDMLERVHPPNRLTYIVNGNEVMPRARMHTVRVTLPTVILTEGALRTSTRKTAVEVYAPVDGEAYLYELGMPICPIDNGFAYSLDVQQKIPLPLSRDMVSKSYMDRLIGSVVDAAAQDGVMLVTESEQGAEFLKPAMDWIRNPEALEATTTSVYGSDAVRWSSDPQANAIAAGQGRVVVSRNTFSPSTVKRMESQGIMPTSREEFGEIVDELRDKQGERIIPDAIVFVCENCGHKNELSQGGF
tara:strand:- start:1731 stop:2933 length:1203 start_codon:yes stop_codon:yes gene_type:complete